MENLILDIKILIASNNASIWWLFYLYFDDFKSYTQRYLSHYCRLFTKTTNQNIKYIACHYINNQYRCYDHGAQEWYQNKKRHRDGGPAVINNGGQYWYQNGAMHRDDGPAFIDENGNQFWYQYGKWHRDGGPAIIYANGDQTWYQHGMRQWQW